MKTVIEFKGISKYFLGVKALDDVSFKAYGGEILTFMGENGAGKSTLLKILNGDYEQTSGEYYINGEPKHFKNTHQAIEAGVGVIYQERQIMQELTVAENVFVERLPERFFGIVDMKAAFEQTQKIIDEFGLNMKATDIVKNLSTAYQQMVEIMKAYSRKNLKVIAFDEPTASLSDAEIESLFKIIKKLKNEGKVVIYVSHRMNEIRDITDKIAIFKDGRFVGLYPSDEISDEDLIVKMVGRNLGDVFSGLNKQKKVGDVLLKVENLGSDYVYPISFELRRGEVLGFSGLVGAGRSEVMRAIIGADRATSGEIYLNGKRIVNRSPKEAIENGIAMVPEDRKLMGILGNLSVGGNIAVSSLKANSSRLGIMNVGKENQMVQKGIRDFAIKTPDADKKALELSGGNQQKTIVARWIGTNPSVLILDEPTKGIDVGAKSEFYELICRLAGTGIGVLLVSSELPEMIGLSDRIIVMSEKRKAGEINAADATEDILLSMAMKGVR